MSAPRIVMFGSSGHAQSMREVMRDPSGGRWLYDVAAYIDDFRGDRGETLEGVPVVGFETWRRTLRDVPVMITLADTATRRRVAERLEAAGATFATCFDGGAVDGDAIAGRGTFLTPSVRIGAGTTFGAHVHLFALSHVPADCAFGDFVTICPVVRIEGRVRFGSGTFVGAGARLFAPPGGTLVLGDDAKIAAGAVVRGDVRAGAFVYGDPAREARAATAPRQQSPPP